MAWGWVARGARRRQLLAVAEFLTMDRAGGGAAGLADAMALLAGRYGPPSDRLHLRAFGNSFDPAEPVRRPAPRPDPCGSAGSGAVRVCARAAEDHWHGPNGRCRVGAWRGGGGGWRGEAGGCVERRGGLRGGGPIFPTASPRRPAAELTALRRGGVRDGSMGVCACWVGLWVCAHAFYVCVCARVHVHKAVAAPGGRGAGEWRC